VRSRTTAVLSLTCLLLLLAPFGASAVTGGATVTGSGFGHGVGMSQYGARSLAVKGWSSSRILQHYYEGVQLEARDVGAAGSRNLFVGLTASQSVWRFHNLASSKDLMHVWLDGNRNGRVPKVAPGDSVRVEHVRGSECTVQIGTRSWTVKCGDVAIRWPVDDSAPKNFVRLPRTEAHDLVMARGWVNFVQATSNTVHTRLQIHMEDYLYGLAEMPSSWPISALAAQAVAGRTFAMNRVNNPRGSSCSCHLLTTVADQHYTGWAKESESPSWRQAVDTTNNGNRTRGRVIEHNGSLINASYSSSSPGRTEASEDIWSAAVPYLRSQDDRFAHDSDANNPRSSWTERFDYADFSQRLGFDAVHDITLLNRMQSGSPATYRVTGSKDGSDRTRDLHSYRDLRGMLGLPSHGIASIDVRRPDDFEWLTGDFTGDGNDDVAGYNKGTGEWMVGVSNGSDAYDFATWGQFRTRAGWQTHLAADITGDGTDEILSYHPGSGNWIVQRSDGSSFRHSVWRQFKTKTGWKTHVTGDVTGNNRQELISFHGGTGNWVVSDGSGSRVWDSFRTKSGWDTHVADVTGDKREDLVNYHPSTGNWMVSRSTGSTFHTSRWARYGTRTGWQTHVVGDVNGSGRADIMSYHSGTRNVILGRSEGDSFSTRVWTQFSSGGWADHFAADVTGNGRAELVSLHGSTGRWIVTRPVSGSARSSVWGELPVSSGWEWHAVTDANGDGRDDMTSFSKRAGTWWVSRSTGGAFEPSRWARM
jgi:SpoIID/LytB domain protein